MARKKLMDEEEAQKEVSVWLGDAQQNIEDAVAQFAMQYLPSPVYNIDVEIMNQAQLRDAMGIRASADFGDPWPKAERKLLDLGFHWHNFAGDRVMFLLEREDAIVVDGWQTPQEVE